MDGNKASNINYDKREIARFLVSGSISTIVYLGLLGALSQFIMAAAASVVCYISAMGLNYFLHRIWTFRSQAAHARALPRFVFTHIGGIVINASALIVLMEFGGIALWPAQGGAIVLVAIWSYIAQKVWVFIPR